MKKILHSVSFGLLALLTFSCSSNGDDSEYNKTVLDTVTEKTYHAVHSPNGDIDKSELSTDIVYAFSYDTSGNVSQIAMLGTDHEDKIDNLVTLVYANNRTLTETRVVSNTTGVLEMHNTFEYNNQNLAIKSTDALTNSFTTFEYDSKRQVIKSNYTSDNYNESIEYIYDVKGNIIRAQNVDNPNFFEAFTYDDKKTPYEHININMLNNQYDLTSYLPLTSKSPYNVHTYIDGETNGNGSETEVKANKENYPIRVTSYYTKSKSKVSSDFTYTYKTIKVKK